MATKNPRVVAVWGHANEVFIHIFCDNGEVYRMRTSPVTGLTMSEKVHSIFPDDDTATPTTVA